MKAAEALERRKVEAQERIAEALETIVEYIMKPARIETPEVAASAPQMVSTPAQQFYPPELPDDTVPVLGDDEDTDHADGSTT